MEGGDPAAENVGIALHSCLAPDRPSEDGCLHPTLSVRPRFVAVELSPPDQVLSVHSLCSVPLNIRLTGVLDEVFLIVGSDLKTSCTVTKDGQPWFSM